MKEHKKILVSILQKNELTSFLPLQEPERLAGDGSSRQFFRIKNNDSGTAVENLIAVLPAEPSKAELAESSSVWHIGRHLEEQNVAIPSLVDWHAESGLVVFEDLGDTRLHDIAHSEKGREMYLLAVKALAEMNCKCGVGLDDNWCGIWSKYNTQFMLEKESGYFLWAFWRDILGNNIPGGIEQECADLAGEVAKFDASFFLHQDFQSRNIMIKNDVPRIIDFQSGKNGPLGYDLASLVNDPYVELDDDLRTSLVELFWQETKAYSQQSFEKFNRQYKMLSCQRSLQIIGAFSFLSAVKKKMFFKEFILPSLSQLNVQLSDDCFNDYPILRKTVSTALAEYSLLASN